MAPLCSAWILGDFGMVIPIVLSWVGLFCSLYVFTESLVHKESLVSFPSGIPKPGSVPLQEQEPALGLRVAL